MPIITEILQDRDEGGQEYPYYSDYDECVIGKIPSMRSEYCCKSSILHSDRMTDHW